MRKQPALKEEKMDARRDALQHHDERTPRQAWLIVGVVLFAGVASRLNQFKVPPLLPVLSQVFHLNIAGAGLLMSVFAVTGILLAFPSGIITRRVGAKLTGLVALSTLAGGCILGAVADTTSMLFISRLIEGVGAGLIAVVAPATIAVWFPPEKRGAPMGVYSIWLPLATVIIFNLAPAVNLMYGWRAVWWITAAIVSASFVMFAAYVRTPPHLALSTSSRGTENFGASNVSLVKALANRNIWLLGLSFGCFATYTYAMQTFFPTYLVSERGYSLADASFITSLGSFVMLVACPLSGWVCDRIRSLKWMIILPPVLLSVSMIFPFRITGWAIPAYTILVMGVIVGAAPPAIYAAAPDVMGDPKLAGIGMALMIFALNLGSFVGPAFFGVMVAMTGWINTGYSLVPIFMTSAIAGWLCKLR